MRSWFKRFNSPFAHHLISLPSKRKDGAFYSRCVTLGIYHWPRQAFIQAIYLRCTHTRTSTLWSWWEWSPMVTTDRPITPLDRVSVCMCVCPVSLKGGCMHVCVCTRIAFPHYSAPVETSSNSNRAKRRKEGRRKKRNILGVVSDCFLICVTWRLITETCEKKGCIAAQ